MRRRQSEFRGWVTEATGRLHKAVTWCHLGLVGAAEAREQVRGLQGQSRGRHDGGTSSTSGGGERTSWRARVINEWGNGSRHRDDATAVKTKEARARFGRRGLAGRVT